MKSLPKCMVCDPWGFWIAGAFAVLGSLVPVLVPESWAITAPVDYMKLDQSIETVALRAGNHDAEGDNEYYFRAAAYALHIDKKEEWLGFAKRKKIALSIGEWGDFKLKSLSYWDKSTDPVLGVTLSGDQIRSLVSSAMSSFKVKEEDIAVLVEIVMFERQQMFGFYGKDYEVAKVTYHPIPETLPRRPNTDNLNLEITDDKGTSVIVSVTYQSKKKVAEE